MRALKYVVTATGPVILAWLLGIIKLPESTSYLDYSRGGSELLNLSGELKKEVKVLVKSEEKEKLSLYSIHFINKSDKHYGQTKVSFRIEGVKPGSELIASSLQGPENFPQSEIVKKIENNGEVTFVMDHINRAGSQARNYFTASFLFSGAAPEKIDPISNEKGIEFRPASDNPIDKWIAGTIYIGAFLSYIWFLWWINRRSNLKLEEKRMRYREEISNYLEENLNLSSSESSKILVSMEKIRDKVYKQPGIIKRFIRRIVEES